MIIEKLNEILLHFFSKMEETNPEILDLKTLLRIFYNLNRKEETLEVLKSIIDKDPVLDNDLRISFQATYKLIIDSIRSSLRRHNQIVDQMETWYGNSEYKTFFLSKKAKLCNHLISTCKEAIEIIDQSLVPNAPDSMASIHFIKFKADLYRYISEYSDETESVTATQESERAYQEAIQIAQASDIPHYHPLYLQLLLNFAVFRHDICKNRDEAISLLNDARKDSEGYQQLQMVDQVESEQTIKLIEDNLSEWTKPDTDDQYFSMKA